MYSREAAGGEPTPTAAGRRTFHSAASLLVHSAYFAWSRARRRLPIDPSEWVDSDTAIRSSLAENVYKCVYHWLSWLSAVLFDDRASIEDAPRACVFIAVLFDWYIIRARGDVVFCAGPWKPMITLRWSDNINSPLSDESILILTPVRSRRYCYYR